MTWRWALINPKNSNAMLFIFQLTVIVCIMLFCLQWAANRNRPTEWNVEDDVEAVMAVICPNDPRSYREQPEPEVETVDAEYEVLSSTSQKKVRLRTKTQKTIK